MLHKLFGIRTVKPSAGRKVPPKPPPAVASARAPAEERPLALKIIHAGGRVDSYYMAVPAAKILEKQPSFVLARPEVFRRPWNSVVRPEEILTPGQKFFIVPRRTVKKLMRRFPRPTRENQCASFVSLPSTDASAVIVSRQKDLFDKSSFFQESDVSIDVSISSVKSSKIKANNKAQNRRVRFFGIDSKHNSDSSFTEKKGAVKENPRKSVKNAESGGKNSKVKVRNAVTWQPNLAVISESISSDE